MTRVLVTLSSAQRVEVCPGSAVLPQHRDSSQDAEAGSALHDALATLATSGRDAMDRALGTIATRWGVDAEALARKLRRFDPHLPDGTLAEAPLALHADGRVLTVKGGRGQYETDGEVVLAGTVDVAWAEPLPFTRPAPRTPPGSTAWAADWKTGSADHVAPVATNLQALGSALLIARWTGAERVVPAICYVRPGRGFWETPLDGDGNARALGPAEFDAVEQRFRAVDAEARRQLRVLEERGAGKLDLVPGAHCRWCPAALSCPVQMAPVRALAVAAPEALAADMTADEAARAAAIYLKLPALGRAIRAPLERYVTARGQVVFADGRAWGPVTTKDTKVRTRQAYEALFAELAAILGNPARAGELADGAFKGTWPGIEAAMKTALDEAGRTKGQGAALRVLRERMLASGGLVEEEGVEWRAHYPAREPAR